MATKKQKPSISNKTALLNEVPFFLKRESGDNTRPTAGKDWMMFPDDMPLVTKIIGDEPIMVQSPEAEEPLTITPNNLKVWMSGDIRLDNPGFVSGGKVYNELLKYVPVTRRINGYQLMSDIQLNKTDIGLGNVDNTSDLNKPISIAVNAKFQEIEDTIGVDVIQLKLEVREIDTLLDQTILKVNENTNTISDVSDQISNHVTDQNAHSNIRVQYIIEDTPNNFIPQVSAVKCYTDDYFKTLKRLFTPTINLDDIEIVGFNNLVTPGSTLIQGGKFLLKDLFNVFKVGKMVNGLVSSPNEFPTPSEITYGTLIRCSNFSDNPDDFIEDPYTHYQARPREILLYASDYQYIHFGYSNLTAIGSIEGTSNPAVHIKYQDGDIDIPLPFASNQNAGIVTAEAYESLININGLTKYGTVNHSWKLNYGNVEDVELLYKTGGSLDMLYNNSDLPSVDEDNNPISRYASVTLGNLTIKGDVVQEGSSFITEAETVSTKDNVILLNAGEVGAGVTKGIAGVEIDRGSLTNYRFVFDESDDRFKIGNDGDLWPVLIRDNDVDLTNGLFLQWDGTNKKAITSNYTKNIFFGTTSLYSTIKAIANGISLSTINVSDQALKIQLNAPDKAAVFTIGSGYYIFNGGDVRVSGLKRISDNVDVVWKEDGKQLMPSPSGTPSASKFLCEDLTWKTVDVNGYLPLTAGPTKKLTGELFAPTLSITSTGAVAHLKFSRADYNYITAPTGGAFAFVPNGAPVNQTNSKLLIHPSGVTIGSGLEPNRTLDVRGDVLIQSPSEGLTISNAIGNPSAIYFRTGGISGTNNRGYLGVDGSTDNVLKLQTLLKGTIAVEAHSGLSLFTGSGDISLNPNSSGGVVSLNSGLQVNPKAGSYCEGIRMSTYGEWSAVQFASDKNAKTGFIAGQWVVGRNPGKGFTICQAGTETTAAIPTTGLGISPNNAGIYFNGATLLTGVGKQRIVGDGNILQLNSANNKAVHIDFMRGGVSKAFVGLGSDANEDVAISSYTSNLVFGAPNGIIRLSQKMVAAQYAGSWIQGKSGASIMYNNYIPLTTSSYDVFYGMKTVSGNVLTFGGIGDQIGFYGYYASRTDNGTDFSFLFDTNSGVITNAGRIHAGSFSISNNINSYMIYNASGVSQDALWMDNTNRIILGNLNGATQIRSNAKVLVHNSNGNFYNIWDSGNFNPNTKLNVNSGVIEVTRIDIPKTNSSDKISIQCYQDRLSISTNATASTVGVNLGSLLVSSAWADSAKVPAFGIYTQGLIHSAAGFKSQLASNLNFGTSHFAADKTWMLEYLKTSTTNKPGVDPNSNLEVNDGYVTSYYWENVNCAQLVINSDGSGIAYRGYNPITGESYGWNFLATTAWVKSQISGITPSKSDIINKLNETGQVNVTQYWVFTGGAGESSDERYKNILRKDIGKVLPIVLDTPILEYTWKNEKESKLGSTAQYWESYFPQIVHEDKDGVKSLEYQKLGVIGLKAIQELNYKLEDNLNKANKKIEFLESKVEEYENILKTITNKLGIIY